MNLKGKNVLVTGGTGFVGSHLVEELLALGANVISTYLDQEPFSYFTSQKFADKITLIPLNICHFDQLHDAITRHQVDFIFHLAAQPLVGVAYDNPKQTIETNVMGTTNVLESARLYGKVQGIIIASSDKAYGKLDSNEYIETDSLKGDQPYEVSKSAADLIAQTYFKTYNLPVVVTRFGNIYGEGDPNYSRIVPGIMKAIVNNDTLELRSNGKHKRDYLYVKDVAKGYILLAEKIKITQGESYNFGSNEAISVLDLIKQTEKTINTKIKYKIMNNAKNEIIYQHLNFQKVSQLGWKPETNLNQGLSLTFQWYQKIVNP